LFRLDGVLVWRERQRDECRLRWAEACRAEEEIRRRAAELCAEIAAEQTQRRGKLESGVIALDDIRARHQYEQALRGELELLQRASEEATRERERRSDAVIEAQREVEVLERLKAAHAEQALQAVRRGEQRQMDEVAGLRAHRRAA